MKQQNGFIDPAITIGAVGAVVVLGLLFIGGPQYNVWQQSLAGKSELARAEYNRQIKVQEANAQREAAKELYELLRFAKEGSYLTHDKELMLVYHELKKLFDSGIR